MSNVKIWFATGASAGFGRALTEHPPTPCHKVVIATFHPRRPQGAIPLNPAPVVKLDVKNPADITAAFAEAEKAFGRIDVASKNYCPLPQHPAKTVKVIEKFANLEDAPIRFPLHRRAIAAEEDEAQKLIEMADKDES